MFVVIMGCGRVGRSLAARMEALGHNVSVIDVKSEALAKLGNDFHGKRVLGQGFDRKFSPRRELLKRTLSRRYRAVTTPTLLLLG